MTRRPIPTTPVLSVVFCILGALCVCGGAVVGVRAVTGGASYGWPGTLLYAPGAVGLLMAGILYLGIAQVLQLLARIAQECARAAEAAEQAAIAAAAPPHAKALYFYQYGSDVRGPIGMMDLRAMRALPAQPRTVTGETLVCQQGTDEWKRLADVMK